MAPRFHSLLGLATVSLTLAPLGVLLGCSAGGNGNSGSGFGGDSAGSNNGSGNGSLSSASMGQGGFNPSGGSNSTGASMGSGGDPTTCAEAATGHTYIGCDFWPTVDANNVWSVFDFAAVVANAGAVSVTATVTQGANGPMVAQTTIPPNSLGTLYLPWVSSLKGPDFDATTNATPLQASVVAPGGAYHLTTTAPVTVYQFNALEYAGMGGPPGKDWSSCPGTSIPGEGCYSFSNDASLLLPSTAMTGNYRLSGHESWVAEGMPILGPNFVVTGVQDGTNVTVTLSPTGYVLQSAGGSQTIPGTPGGGTLTFSLNAGDAVEITADFMQHPNADFSGSLVQANNPIQVITGMPCVYIPSNAGYCDHIEESVLPAETLGKHYFVTRVAGPNIGEAPQAQWVKLYGNVDGTTLTYPAGVEPPNAPMMINAGDVVDLGQVDTDFEIKGDHEFAISTFTLAASIVDPNTQPPKQKGDPAQSMAIAVEQYRQKYVFLAPTDYDTSYVDVIQPMSATVTIDGATAPAPTAIGSSSYGINHLHLAMSNGGAHVLTSSVPVGIQVVGYGSYTSYAYPGGLNLNQIAPPPPPPM